MLLACYKLQCLQKSNLKNGFGLTKLWVTLIKDLKLLYEEPIDIILKFYLFSVTLIMSKRRRKYDKSEKLIRKLFLSRNKRYFCNFIVIMNITSSDHCDFSNAFFLEIV